MLKEYLEFYSAYSIALEDDDDPYYALEGFLDTTSSILRAGEKFIGEAKNVIVNIIEQFIANIVVIVSNIRGYYINKKSEIVMRQIIREFDTIIDMCTYNQDKIFQGLSQADIKNGVEIFNTKSVIDIEVMEHTVILSKCVKTLKDYKETLSREGNKIDAIGYKKSVELQRDMMKLSSKMRALSKKTKILLSSRLTAKKYGMDRVIDYMMDVNKRELSQMSAMLMDMYSLIKVKPAGEKA